MLGFISTVKRLSSRSNLIKDLREIHLSSSWEAARKGTREKARKKKVKVEVQKVGFIPHNLRNKDKLDLNRTNKHVDDSWKAIAEDNCYVGKYYRWRVFSVEDAIECHRETHHPTMYNIPNAPLNVHIELNMQAEKSTRFIENFNRMAMIPNSFDHGEERKILVFAKNEEEQQEAKKLGVELAGGTELIKNIQNGEILLSDYHFIIAHTNILPEIVSLRGLMKKKFPNPKSGTLGTNLTEMIAKFANGISYSAVRDEYQKDFGLITTCIGTLNMDKKHLEENLICLLKDIDSVRPKRQGKFITKVLLKSPPSQEQLKIDPFLYISEEHAKGKNTVVQQENDENVDEEKEAAVN